MWFVWWVACGSETGISALPRACDPGPPEPPPTARWACGAPCGAGEETWAITAETFWRDEVGHGLTGTPLVLPDGEGGLVVALSAGGVNGLPARLVLVGADGAERFDFRGEHGLWATELEAADLDGDGVSELVVALDPDPGATPDWRLAAVDLDGEVRWIADALPFGTSYGACLPVVGDLEGDGALELVCGEHVLDAATGEVLRDLEGPDDERPMELATVLADLDGDGVDEILRGGVTHDASGRRLRGAPWLPEVPVRGLQTNLPLAADADPALEQVAVTFDQVHLVDDDGEVRWTRRLGGDHPGSPCLGDLDGDGATDLVVPSQRRLRAYDLDGELLWSVPSSDGSTAAGCTLFDLDGDGDDEVLYADEDAFVVRCGATGELLYADAGHSSGTLSERPAVVDLDGDGSAEILVASDDWSPGAPGDHADPTGNRRELTVYRSATGAFAGAEAWTRRLPVSEAPEARLPAVAPTGAPAVTFPPEPRAAVVVQDLQLCRRTCDQPVQVRVTVANLGSAPSGATSVSVRVADGEHLVPVPPLAAGASRALEPLWIDAVGELTATARTADPPGCGLPNEIVTSTSDMACEQEER